MNALQDSLKEIGILFNNAPNLLQAIHKAIDENAELRKQAEEYVKEKMIVLKDRMVKSAESIDGVKLIRFIGPMPSDMVKGIAFLLRGEVSKGLAFVAATRDIGDSHIALVVARLIAELLRNAERAIERITDRAAKRRTELRIGSNGHGRIAHQLFDIGNDILPDLVDILSDALLHLIHGRPPYQ